MAFHDTGRAKPFGARCGRGSRTMPRKFSWQLADGSWWSLEANPGDATVSHQLPTINLVAAATGRGPPDGGRDSSARGWRCAPTGVGVSPNGGFDLPQRRVSLPPTERKPSPDIADIFPPPRVCVLACVCVCDAVYVCVFACQYAGNAAAARRPRLARSGAWRWTRTRRQSSDCRGCADAARRHFSHGG